MIASKEKLFSFRRLRACEVRLSRFISAVQLVYLVDWNKFCQIIQAQYILLGSPTFVKDLLRRTLYICPLRRVVSPALELLELGQHLLLLFTCMTCHKVLFTASQLCFLPSIISRRFQSPLSITCLSHSTSAVRRLQMPSLLLCFHNSPRPASACRDASTSSRTCRENERRGGVGSLGGSQGSLGCLHLSASFRCSSLLLASFLPRQHACPSYSRCCCCLGRRCPRRLRSPRGETV